MRLVAVAKAGGGINYLYPDGDAWNAPWPLVFILTEASRFIGYLSLPEDESPPPRMWNNPERLKLWFNEVERRRNSDSTQVPVEDPEMESTGALEMLRGNTAW